MVKWKIWKDMVPRVLTNSDCDNDVDGVCDKNLTLQQCMERAPENIDYGLFLKMKNGKTICDHVDTSMYIPSHINFNYNIVSKDKWDELRDTETWTFVNTGRNPFPEWDGKYLHFLDKIDLKVGQIGRICRVLPFRIFPREEIPMVKVLDGDGIYFLDDENKILTVVGGEFSWVRDNIDNVKEFNIYNGGEGEYITDSIILSWGGEWVGVKDGKLVLTPLKKNAEVFSIKIKDVDGWTKDGVRRDIDGDVETSRSPMVVERPSHPSSLVIDYMLRVAVIVFIVVLIYLFSSF